ncbi:hypothetical protein CY0110_19657 [Crocosphaera chwakensis CCY0110]|uniref:Uncharacterized protein n=1 Tax=Crocosphaera chwakensis CCY0110 TaxID=391612 RepID=A3IJR3_9CHRO|nr:hypothetical protein CY0110_19657 [Crocosphaera chwakensis CCY0110]
MSLSSIIFSAWSCCKVYSRTLILS